MLPLVSAGIAQMGGGLAGSIANQNDIQKGMNAYKNYVGQGTSQLRTGMEAANQAFNPYTSAGANAVGGLSSAIANRTQAALPTVQDASGANAIANYLNPSAAYSQDQARQQAQAAGAASGAMGGGMMKALSNNANKMAQTNYNDAYNQMLNANQQRFGQQQQNYANTNEFQQQNIQNLAGLAGQGLSATGINQDLQQDYNTGINQNFENIASNQGAGYNALGGLKNAMYSNIGNQAAQYMPSFQSALGIK